MKKKYIKPTSGVVRLGADDLLAPQLRQGSIGQQTQASDFFQTVETFKIEEYMQFTTEAQRREFWDDWDNGAD